MEEIIYWIKGKDNQGLGWIPVLKIIWMAWMFMVGMATGSIAGVLVTLAIGSFFFDLISSAVND